MMVRWTFPVVLLLIINLVVITSFPHADNEGPGGGRVERSYKQHSTGHQQTLGRSGFFATENSTVVVAQIGGTAALPCVVRKFNNGVVSWIRREEQPKLLTVGLITYSADGRIFVEHVRHLQNWGLIIKPVQLADSGLYECQISTHPVTSIFMELKVIEASAAILGGPDVHLRAGSLLRLVCRLHQSTEQPSYVFWYHEDRMINYDLGVEVIPNRDSSILLLQDADKSHAGNYTCHPSNAIPASINVHVLNATEEENPAAMLHANCCCPSTSVYVTTLIGLLVNFLLQTRRI
ncbi:PREDICTED: titin-like [Nicrophorus vespilloides]|uniref:Titin-like n=1 Tax=Nicrophorus vespilloides TaxID=110193 RepID=A0ABM1NB31_NICVS|nr:PREDICTED: titin-like [Nicrophorus vespilloides]